MDCSERFHIPALFCRDFFSAGFTLIPNLLFRYNARLALEKLDLLVILALFYFQQEGKRDACAEDIAKLLNTTAIEVERAIEVMQARGLLELKGEELVPSGLFEKIADFWAEEKVQALQRTQTDTPEVKVIRRTGRFPASYLTGLINTFEEEFGRPLTPIECSQIIRWYKEDGYSEELILDALKRAVLRGVCNLNYIDKILVQWHKNNLHTTFEVAQFEERYQERKERRKGKSSEHGSTGTKDDKYKDLYLT